MLFLFIYIYIYPPPCRRRVGACLIRLTLFYLRRSMVYPYSYPLRSISVSIPIPRVQSDPLLGTPHPLTQISRVLPRVPRSPEAQNFAPYFHTPLKHLFFSKICYFVSKIDSKMDLNRCFSEYAEHRFRLLFSILSHISPSRTDPKIALKTTQEKEPSKNVTFTKNMLKQGPFGTSFFFTEMMQNP